MIHIIFNPTANNGRGLEGANKLKACFENESFKFYELISINDVTDFIQSIPQEEKIVLAGGDGTLNLFINRLDGNVPSHEILYTPAGSGNDFWKDLEVGDANTVLLNPYIEKLPKVTVNGKTSYFLNGVGYGIDGYCCEKADEIRKKSNKRINYTKIAIKGLLYDFKPRKARVTVDGVSSDYDHVWLVPIMNGRFYGGGMMVAPNQDRLNEKRTVSCIVMHCKFNLHALIIFPNIFKGTLINHKKNVALFTGKHVVVEFDKPCALQIDGETILNVSKCECIAHSDT